jgi:flavin reductase (DIM6/NTAB) family NADH-FMN oxidoreductase RutF
VPASSHSIFIGHVAAVELHPDLDPLVYVEGDYSLIVPFMTSDK